MKTPQDGRLSTTQNASYVSIPSHDENCYDTLPSSFLGLQTELIRALYDSEGLDGLSCKLADHVNGCAVILDLNGSQRSVSFSPKIDADQIKALRQILSARDKPIAGSAGDEIHVDHTVNSIDMPLRFDGDYAGTLLVLRLGAPFSESERQLLVFAAGIFCVQLAQDKKVAGIERRLKGNFVEDLIFMHYSDPESILNRARSLDYNVSAVHRVLVAEIENYQQVLHHFGGDQAAAANYKTELVQTIQNCIDKAHKGMVINSKETFVLLVQEKLSGSDISDFKVLSEEIIADAALQFKANIFMGIGSRTTELSDFSKSYMEAKKALEIGEYMITEGQVRSFEQFKVHALFLSTLKPVELYNYARDQLEALLAYDDKHHTDFLKTLQEFLYLRNNVEGTAKSLNMSVSGLKYRLHKIEKIIGLDLKDYKVSFDLQLALVIMQLFGEYRIKEKKDR